VEERGKKVLETHKLLLEREIVVLEGLDLSKVQEGHYELVALPLKLSSLDGSPVRAVLKTIL
jgi:arylformamidase